MNFSKSMLIIVKNGHKNLIVSRKLPFNMILFHMFCFILLITIPCKLKFGTFFSDMMASNTRCSMVEAINQKYDDDGGEEMLFIHIPASAPGKKGQF